MFYGDSWLTIKQNKNKGTLYPTVSVITKLPNNCKPGEIITIREPRISAWPDSMYIFNIIVPNNVIPGQTIVISSPSQKYIEEYEDFYFKQLVDNN